MTAEVKNVKLTEGRQGEKKGNWRRSRRFFSHEGKWYFQTREGIDVGPYKTSFDAEVESRVLISKLNRAAKQRAGEVIRGHIYEGPGASNYLAAPEFTSYVIEEGDLSEEEESMLVEFLQGGLVAA